MCGIVGYTGPREAYPIIIKGLQRLEYRGYDSTGVALLNHGLHVFKKKGKVAELADIVKNLTMHIARHTFGNISGEKISIHMLQKLYRHTSITTTIGYQANFLHKDADDALDAVIGF